MSELQSSPSPARERINIGKSRGLQKTYHFYDFNKSLGLLQYLYIQLHDEINEITSQKLQIFWTRFSKHLQLWAPPACKEIPAIAKAW